MLKIIRTCDRCKKEVEENDFNQDVTIILSEDSYRKRDLCGDCFTDVLAFFEGIGLEEEQTAPDQEEPKEETEQEEQTQTVEEIKEEVEKIEKNLEELTPEEAEMVTTSKGNKVFKNPILNDMGKFEALLKAGWTSKQIQEEFGATPLEYSNALRKLRGR